ncbi:hypothetical protein M878_04970 [Streptomyces roseochromogenus subsp. oscitans DS 12.976]|uniref:Uncharacterized protein n=1 Tax=Streptomyces roseochromogenus subsp. oscitans DS 12.976 TaxID=1352936 RepID=V6L3D8_STRRC|nr:hypothetical protein M878_04970 [Streptomyces roseochromogenus subsp. oscitans DS 12.976]
MAAGVRTTGGTALARPADVADARALEAAAARTEREPGPIEVCYPGYGYGPRAALRRKLPRDHGAVVQAGSALGR